MNAPQDEHTGAHGMPGGLAISAAGYTLRATPTVFEPGRQEEFSVRVLDEAGRQVRNLDEQHGQRMHLIVVRRDLMYYQHLHPSLNENGSWTPGCPSLAPRPPYTSASVARDRTSRA